jgi:hypothetical protein
MGGRGDSLALGYYNRNVGVLGEMVEVRHYVGIDHQLETNGECASMGLPYGTWTTSVSLDDRGLISKEKKIKKEWGLGSLGLGRRGGGKRQRERQGLGKKVADRGRRSVCVYDI